MTGQSLLDAMEVLNQELQLQTSEADQARGLVALNMAQDYFESLAAQEGAILGDTTANVTTTAATETTAFPTGFLRLDRLQLLDAVTSLPRWDLDNIIEVGGHAWNRRWPYDITMTSAPGAPESYYTNARNIYWSPLPDATYTIRCYGFKAATDITAIGTFLYADELRLPMAAFAVRIMSIGLGDDVADVAALASQTFSDSIASLTAFNRDGASPFVYRYGHNT
jgi:hypothetical protein